MMENIFEESDDVFLDILKIKIIPPNESGKKLKKLRKNRRARKSLAVDFYRSDEWMQLRYKALKLHGAACQCCGATRKDGIKLHVDHIKPRSKYKSLELRLDNLQVLCEACNLGKSNTDSTDWR